MPAPRHLVDVVELRAEVRHLHPEVEVLATASRSLQRGREVAFLGKFISHQRRDWERVRHVWIPLLPSVAADWIGTTNHLKPRPDDI